MPKTYNNKGFALILTLSLAGFLVLILVGLATFARVETSVANVSQQQAQARANALFALNQAVGMLQQYAGDDRRVTARADLADPAPTNGTQFWTGVFNSTDDAGPIAWLVNENLGAPLANSPSAAPRPLPTANSNTDFVFLVNQSGPNNDAARIRLRKSPILADLPGFTTPATVGRYAFWVGDEGIKASVAGGNDTELVTFNGGSPINNYSGLPDPLSNRARLAQLIMHAPRLDQAFGNAPWAEAVETDNALRRALVTPFQLAAAATVLLPIRNAFHDVGGQTLGVLSSTLDVTNGLGLRLDAHSSLPPPAQRVGNSNPVFTLPAFSNLRFASATDPLRLEINAFPPLSVDGVTLIDVDVPASSNGQFVLTGMPVLVEFEFVPTFAIIGNIPHLSAIEVRAKFWNPYNVTLRFDPNDRLQIVPTDLPNYLFNDGANTGQYSLAQVLQDLVFPPSPPPLPPYVPVSDIPSVLSINTNDFPGNSIAPGQVIKVNGSFNFELGLGAIPLPLVSGPAPASPPTYAGTQAGLIRVLTRWYDSSSSSFFPISEWRGVSVPSLPDTNTGWCFRMENWNGIGNKFLNVFNPISPVWVSPASGADAFMEVDRSGAFDTVPDDFQVPGAFPQTRNNVAVLFEMPRQDVLSVGWVRHLASMPNGATNLPAYRVGRPGNRPENQIFDTYFASGIPDIGALTDEALTYRNRRYPNTNLIAYFPAADTRITNANLRETLERRQRRARFLMQRHAFNINSTSEAAWRAMLAGSNLPTWSYVPPAPGSVVEVNLQNAHFRFTQSGQRLIYPTLSAALGANTPDTAGFRIGIRELTDDQVAAIAAEIVKRLQDIDYPTNRNGTSGGTRPAGLPFRTLAQFVSSGILQDAIDNAAPAVNSDLVPNSPGALSQHDILERLAPYLSARSDTFIVRAYGEVVDPLLFDATTAINGRATRSQAWLEAVVQRFPDYVDQSNEVPLGGTNQLTNEPGNFIGPNAADLNALNQNFGRKFRVISLRWLSPDEV